MTATLQGHLAAPRQLLTEPFAYVSENPLRFPDPKGLCRSGACADCPSGAWTQTSASASVFAFFGGTAGTVTLRCLGADKTCRYWFWCVDGGLGWDVGVGAAGGIVGAPNSIAPGDGCRCAESFTGWGIGSQRAAALASEALQQACPPRHRAGALRWAPALAGVHH